VWLWLLVNPLSAALALSACLFYVFVYTLWLKRTSRQNIVIGGAAGAVPVLIGWSSVTNTVSVSAVVLFGVIFFWTPPHFWALAIRYREDYARVDVPMMPAVSSLSDTANQMILHSVLMVALSLVFGWTAGLGPLYWVGATVLGAVILWLTVDVRRTLSSGRAMRLFTWSITYVTLLFGLMAADVLLRSAIA